MQFPILRKRDDDDDEDGSSKSAVPEGGGVRARTGSCIVPFPSSLQSVDLRGENEHLDLTFRVDGVSFADYGIEPCLARVWIKKRISFRSRGAMTSLSQGRRLWPRRMWPGHVNNVLLRLFDARAAPIIR